MQGDDVDQLTEALQVLQQLDIAPNTVTVIRVGTGSVGQSVAACERELVPARSADSAVQQGKKAARLDLLRANIN